MKDIVLLYPDQFEENSGIEEKTDIVMIASISFDDASEKCPYLILELDTSLEMQSKWKEGLALVTEHIELALNALKKDLYVAKLKTLSETEALTQLYNRLKIDKELIRAYNLFKRYKQSCSLILVDIDFFKKVNDTHGHQVGDNVLIKISEILRDGVRNTDIVGRWGGEEFLIICTDSQLEDSEVLANNLREKIANTDFKIAGKLSASFGLSTFKANLEINKIIGHADTALYSAKQQGRNKVCKFTI